MFSRVHQDIFKSTCRSPFVVDVSATGGARLCNAAVTETIHNPWTRELLQEVRPCTDFEKENPTPCTDFETKKSTHRVHDHFSVYTSMSDDVSLCSIECVCITNDLPGRKARIFPAVLRVTGVMLKWVLASHWYELQRSDMIRTCGAAHLNERLLFHGSLAVFL